MYARLSTVCTVNGDTWTKTGPFSGLLQEVAIWKILKEHPHALYVSADISQGIASIALRRMTPLTEYTKSPEGRAILASQCWSLAASLVSFLHGTLDQCSSMASLHAQVSELKTLHSYSILHRDINPANIVLGCVPGSSTLIAFIIDFDYALLHGKHPLDPTGCNALQSNARFMSPRLLMSEGESIRMFKVIVY